MSKAFDTVDRKKLMNQLEELLNPSEMGTAEKVSPCRTMFASNLDMNQSLSTCSYMLRAISFAAVCCIVLSLNIIS